ncbi:response regulator [Desulforhopalus sp. IMCC35007]|uniref:response regulator n=1 Tax=Desulforhopalus sp. IMCC35007 TaxID=2569543 RepID=UPI0010AEC395|nr:response regulator [Desulforhopalus sp. IMCC35007]TKB10308.1 response regulator [Desulforhopalus sp. IMCC35007]
MKNLSILVVDDDPVLRHLLRKRLKIAGYSVESAEDGYVARDLIHKQSFDVVLTDLMMPGDIGGLEVLELAKEKDSSIEVVLITAHSSVDTAVQAMKKGAADYLEKPVNFDELFLRLDKIANIQTMYRSAVDLRLALSRTEGEAGQTIQMLELLCGKLQQSLDEIETTLEKDGATSEERVASALAIIRET